MAAVLVVLLFPLSAAGSGDWLVSRRRSQEDASPMAAVIVGLLFLLGAAGAVYQQVGMRRQRRRFRAPGHFVDVGGHRLHVVCTGRGSPLVLFESGIAA